MNVEIGTMAAQFLFWEKLFPVFDIGSLQCGRNGCLMLYLLYTLFYLQ
jgi:hypothetical protein